MGTNEAAIQALTRATVQDVLAVAQQRAAVLADHEQRAAFIISALGMAYVSAAARLAPDRATGFHAIRQQFERMLALVEAEHTA
jgi:hypothetical protein